MAKRKEEQQDLTGMRRVVYPGPHEACVLKNVPTMGDLSLVRGAAIELPAAIADDLIKRKKVKAAKAAKEDAPTPESTPDE
jgi:hypothetical protein